MGGRCRLAGTKAAVAVHPLKGMERVGERGVSGDLHHGKVFEVFSRGNVTTKLSSELVRRLGGWYINLDQVLTMIIALALCKPLMLGAVGRVSRAQA